MDMWRRAVVGKGGELDHTKRTRGFFAGDLEFHDFFRDANKESADGDGRWKNRTEYRSRPLPPVQAESKWLTIIPRR
jgi:hypothetical protein